MPERPVKLLIVDDSALVRKRLSESLSKDPEIEVVGTAVDPYVARDKILKLEPDVLTLDIEMPRMDGLTFLKRVMKYRPMPVIILSSLTKEGSSIALEALRCGAVDVLGKSNDWCSTYEDERALAERIKAAARARLQDVEVALNLARQRATLNTLLAPIAGEIYGLAVRPGAYVNVGDLAANVGRLDRLRVRVYVDEPELGRVAEGQPVTITWDALPGKQWHGTVERKPASIQALGSRQVGEVICSIENPGRELVPGANVNAEIRTAVVEGALVVPKETLRHDAQGDYVFALTGDTVARRPVKKGASSVTEVQVVQGLAEGDAVALPSDVPLKPGDRVAAAM